MTWLVKTITRTPQPHKANAAWRLLAPFVAILFMPLGCSFSEKSMPMRSGDLVAFAEPPPESVRSTRDWLTYAHGQLEHLLPSSRRKALLTDDLTNDSGHTIDVAAHFKLTHRNLRSLLGNWKGLLDSAHSIGGGPYDYYQVPAWPGFADVWVPVGSGIELAGRLGFAVEDGRVRQADCIVLLPGMFGGNTNLRTRELAIALRANGSHVLALELRGHGRTDLRFPDLYYTFGVREAGDLLRVSEWLEDLPQVERTGMIGFCWGANVGLTASWFEAYPMDHPTVTEGLARCLTRPSSREHYRAGIMAFSPIFKVTELIEELERRHSILKNPVLSSMQDTIHARIRQKNHPHDSHSLNELVGFEFARSGIDHAGAVSEAFLFMQITTDGDKPSDNKLANVATPTLIVFGANDPLRPAQSVADVVAGLDNPNVAAMILPGGGHVGFPAYAREYYFSLILNFFDRDNGAAATTARSVKQTVAERSTDKPLTN